MAVKSKPYYWLVCDRCGRRCDYGDFSAMADESQALESAEDSDWLLVGHWPDYSAHYCPSCVVVGDDGPEPMPPLIGTAPSSPNSGEGE